MSRVLEFIAEGEPAGKGSLRTFQSKHNGRHMGDWASNVKRFQRIVERAAVAAREEHDVEYWMDPIDGPVDVVCEFRFPCAKSRERTAIEHGVIWHATRHDIDKLCRTVLDGLQRVGIVQNDARVVRLTSTKYECSPDVLASSFEGVRVKVTEIVSLP